MQKCIGLFGTCAGSLWRDPFIEKYNQLNIPFFNPVVPDWKPECAEIEADHLANDAVILFPVTSESYGCGSLSEVGFSIVQAIRLDDRRFIIVLISKELDSHLMTSNSEEAKDSLRARALVRQHLKKLNLPNIFIVDTLEQMMSVSLILYRNIEAIWDLQCFNPQNIQ